MSEDTTTNDTTKQDRDGEEVLDAEVVEPKKTKSKPSEQGKQLKAVVHRPKPVKRKPLLLQLKKVWNKDSITHVQITDHRDPDEPMLVTYVLPDATEVSDYIPGEDIVEAVDAGAGAPLLMAMAMLRAAGLDEQTRSAIVGLPQGQMQDVLMTWMDSRNQAGVSAGE